MCISTSSAHGTVCVQYFILFVQYTHIRTVLTTQSVEFEMQYIIRFISGADIIPLIVEVNFVIKFSHLFTNTFNIWNLPCFFLISMQNKRKKTNSYLFITILYYSHERMHACLLLNNFTELKCTLQPH